MAAFRTLKKLGKVVLLGILVLEGSLTFAYKGLPGPKFPNNLDNQNGTFPHSNSTRGQNAFQVNNVLSYIETLPKQELSEEEIKGIEYMREEEKLARDVYLTLYDKWGLPIFRNIARSEQNHMNAVKVLIDKYNLSDPVEETGDRVGVFKNPEIQELYNKLVEEGSKSVVDALKVGATIEDLDIEDLEKNVNETDNKDIKMVYNNLMKGSRNHLRAFTSQLERYGETYNCQFIPQEQCESIINSRREIGVVYDYNNKPLNGGVFNNRSMFANRDNQNVMVNNQEPAFVNGDNNGMMRKRGMGNVMVNNQEPAFVNGDNNGMMRKRGMDHAHGYGQRFNISLIKQNKFMFRERIMQREKILKQQIKQVKEKVITGLKTKKRLNYQTKEEVINLIKQMLSLKLQFLLVEVVDTPLEKKYAPEIQQLLDEVDKANDVNSLKALVFKYVKLKLEIAKSLGNQQ